MNPKNRLTNIVEKFVKQSEWPTLRGIIAFWEKETLNINFFFEGRIPEHLHENVLFQI